MEITTTSSLQNLRDVVAADNKKIATILSRQNKININRISGSAEFWVSRKSPATTISTNSVIGGVVTMVSTPFPGFWDINFDDVTIDLPIDAVIELDVVIDGEPFSAVRFRVHQVITETTSYVIQYLDVYYEGSPTGTSIEEFPGGMVYTTSEIRYISGEVSGDISVSHFYIDEDRTSIEIPSFSLKEVWVKGESNFILS